MDDFAAGAQNEIGKFQVYHELSSIMNLINLPLAKWVTNTDQLKAIWKAEGQNVEARTQVLGVSWNTTAERLCIDAEEVTETWKEGPTTKRRLLQTTARFYDPLFSPVSLVWKVLFQDTWNRASTGTCSCPQILQNDGTFGYLFCLPCRK